MTESIINRSAYEKLPEKYKNVIYLFYYEGYSAVEITEIFHTNVNTIYTWLSRAKKQLGTSLEVNLLKNKIYNAFNDIKAEEKLKRGTSTFLQEKINKKDSFYSRRFAAALASLFIILMAGGLSYHL